jgi:hypothetical protein
MGLGQREQLAIGGALVAVDALGIHPLLVGQADRIGPEAVPRHRAQGCQHGHQVHRWRAPGAAAR